MSTEIEIKNAFKEVLEQRDNITAVMLDDEFINITVKNKTIFKSKLIEKGTFEAFKDYQHFFDVLDFINKNDIEIVNYIDDTLYCEYNLDIIHKLKQYSYIRYEILNIHKKHLLAITFSLENGVVEEFIKSRWFIYNS